MQGKSSNNNINAFFALVRAGLWEKSVQLLPYVEVDFTEIQRLAEEQSVVGLIAGGLEQVIDIKIAKKYVLQFISQTLRLEQRNQAMNYFIGVLVDKMRKEGIYTLLVKGQGIAQCYERPLWRSCGDVDLFLNEDDYQKAKQFLIPLASKVDPEGNYSKHLGMTIESWIVELHGSMRCGLSNRVDRVLNEIGNDILLGRNVRSWMNGHIQVFLPDANSDIIYVFTHFLNHFYKGGIGLRQFCDWCRLLWNYRKEIKKDLLEKRLRRMGLLTEWKAFGAFVVNYLGLSADAMPLFEDSARWRKKADLIGSFILEVGNFGHNRDLSYFEKYPYVMRKAISFCKRCGDLTRHARLFPLDSFRFFPKIMINGLRAAVRGE